MVADINEAMGQETVDLIEEEGGTAKFIRVDLRDSASIKALMDDTAQAFDGIDVLHSNSAIHETDLTPNTSIEELDEAVWDAVNNINLKGVWLFTRHAVPYLVDGGALAWRGLNS